MSAVEETTLLRRTPWSIVVASLFVVASATFMGISAQGWSAFLWSIYGNGTDWPISTAIYLSSTRWFFVIPVILGLVLWVFARRGVIERHAMWTHLALHAITLAILMFTALAAIAPFLSTTFEMGRQ